MIHVELRALGALQQHPASLLQGLRRQEAGIGQHRNQPWSQALQQLDVLVGAHALFYSHHFEAQIDLSRAINQESTQAVQRTEVACAHSPPSDLVLVRRTDTAPGGTNALPFLNRGVQHLVIWEDKVSTIRNDQTPRHVDTAGDQIVHFLQQCLRV